MEEKTDMKNILIGDVVITVKDNELAIDACKVTDIDVDGDTLTYHAESLTKPDCKFTFTNEDGDCAEADNGLTVLTNYETANEHAEAMVVLLQNVLNWRAERMRDWFKENIGIQLSHRLDEIGIKWESVERNDGKFHVTLKPQEGLEKNLDILRGFGYDVELEGEDGILLSYIVKKTEK